MLLVYGSDPYDPDVGIGTKTMPLIAVDTETTGLDYHSEILMVSMAWMASDEKIYSAVFEPRPGGHDTLLKDLLADYNVVFHNLPFDFRLLFKTFGVMPGPKMHDTMIIARSVDWQDSLSLVDLYEKYVGPFPEHLIALKGARKNFAKIAREKALEYAAFDAVSTLELYLALRPLMQETMIPSLYARDKAFTKLVMDMICRGVKLDTDYCMSKANEFRNRADDLLKIFTEKGVIKAGSPAQIIKMLIEGGVPKDEFPVTEKGNMSATADVLDAIARKYPQSLAKDVVEYRQLNSFVKDRLMDWVELSQYDGYIHSELHPFGTHSFRMTSKDPNLLGLPMEDRGRAFGSAKGAFISDKPDHVLYALDIKQAEVRLGAMLSHEDNLATTLAAGTDPYKMMSKQIWGTEDRRQQAKQAVLAAFYELGPASFSERYEVSEEEARSILGDLRSTYPNIKITSRFFSNFAEANRYVEAFDGRRVYFAFDDDFYKAYNQRIQTSVAELMQDAMLNVEAEYPGDLRLQIHDCLVLDMPNNEEEIARRSKRVQEIVADCIPEEVYNMTNPRVPFLVDGKMWQ